jgi:hypothetical protein
MRLVTNTSETSLSEPTAESAEERSKRLARERSARWRANNPERARATVQRWHAENPDYARKRQAEKRRQDPGHKRRQHLKDRYGINAEDYDRMFDQQGGCCAICAGSESRAKSEHFHVDHCHSTGRVRALLCGPCNTKLGWYEANRAGIEAYLEEHQ